MHLLSEILDSIERNLIAREGWCFAVSLPALRIHGDLSTNLVITLCH